MADEEFDIEAELSGRQYILALRLQNRKIQSFQELHTTKDQEI
jgi:hypothetical protein